MLALRYPFGITRWTGARQGGKEAAAPGRRRFRICRHLLRFALSTLLCFFFSSLNARSTGVFVTLTPANCAVSSGITFFPANRPPDWSSEVWMHKVAAIASSAAVISARILSQLPAAAPMCPMSAQARLPFDLMPGPCYVLHIGVREQDSKSQ